MTETDATRRPLQIPPKFIPYLEKHKVYTLIKNIASEILLSCPEDHIGHIHTFLRDTLKGANRSNRIILLCEPSLDIDMYALTKILLNDMGCVAITRPLIVDHYEKKFGSAECVTPMKMAETLKELMSKEPTPRVGWILMDHPCSLDEARCMQRLGLIPAVTILMTPPGETQTTVRPKPLVEKSRGFYDQNIEVLKNCFSATRKDLIVESSYPLEKIAAMILTAVRSCLSGLQCAGKSLHSSGAPGVYRVALIGCKGSGRTVQADMLARNFNLVHVNLGDLMTEATLRHDELGERIRKFGKSDSVVQKVLTRRILQKDCLERGWVLTRYTYFSTNFELLDSLETPPNRIIFLTVDCPTARARIAKRGYNWATGKEAPMNSGPQVLKHPHDEPSVAEKQLDHYYSEVLPELRAASGLTAIEVDATLPPGILRAARTIIQGLC